MPPSSKPRVFISYARRDGAGLAQRLQADLNNKGFEAWIDKQRIEGGAIWTDTIEQAIDESDYLLALLTPGSYVSEICRAEQLRSLRKGRCVIPLLAEQGSDIPLHLEAKNYRDFSVTSKYAQSFNDLLTDLHARNGVVLKEEFRATSYVTVPPLPINFVERPEAVTALRNALMTEDGGRHVGLTALQGMGGIGKTVLAQALCGDEVVQQAFPDGVIWVTIGKESHFDPLTRMREVARALNDDVSRYDNLLAAKSQYRTALTKKAALIVVDDVWRSRDLEPFLAENSPRSRLLFTTRDATVAAAVGAREHIAELLSEEKSRQVLARWAGTQADELLPIAGDLIHECGRLPLAISMVGAMVRGKPPALWKRVLELLRGADLAKIKAQFPDYPYTDVLRALQVSVDLLDDSARERYLALAVLLEEMSAAPQVQQCIWGVDEGEAVETAEQFISLSLAQRGKTEAGIKLHDLQLDYVRAQWPREQKEALELIKDAVRLSSNVIVKDPSQFASQMAGRLLPYKDIRSISEFIDRVAEGAHPPWLRPLRATLHPPGTALLRTLGGQACSLNGVALSGDGRLAVSASADYRLRVWDVANGTELRTLEGHSGEVRGVTLTDDGRLAVSASSDETLKVWEVKSGLELRTLRSHSGPVNSAAVSEDGRLAVSASSDQTLKVWDLGTGRVLRTLNGHSGYIWDVAMTRDGRLAVSASSDRTLKVWVVESGHELRTLRGHTDWVNGVALSGDGRLAVSASRDKTLKVWEVASGKELCKLIGHSSYVHGVAVSENGQLAVSGSEDRTLKVWQVANSQAVHTLPGHSYAVNRVAMSRDGRLAVSASVDGTLKVWDLQSVRAAPIVPKHSFIVNDVAISRDSRLAFSASSDGTAKVWETATGREVRTIKGHSHVVTGIAVTTDGQIAVSASFDNTLKVWDVEHGHELRTLSGHTRAVFAVALSGDEQVAVSASADYDLKVWQVGTGRELNTLSGHRDRVRAVAVSEDGRFAVSASEDKELKVWNLRTGRFRTLTGHLGAVYGVAITSDGKQVVSASGDQTLKVWELESGRELRTLNGHAAAVAAVAVSADCQHAVSASADRTVRIWNLGTGQVLATFSCDAAAYCCAFYDPLKLIVVGDAAGDVHFLRLEGPKAKS